MNVGQTISLGGGHGKSAKSNALVVPGPKGGRPESQCNPSIVDNSPGEKESNDTGKLAHTISPKISWIDTS